MTQLYYTVKTGPIGRCGQQQPSHSLGGYMSRTEFIGNRLHGLFNAAGETDVKDLRPDYRCLWYVNTGNTAVTCVKVWTETPEQQGSLLTVGVDPVPPSPPRSLSPGASVVTNCYVKPRGVTFGPSAIIGAIGAGAGRAFWICRLPCLSSSEIDCGSIYIEADGVLATRCVSWTSWRVSTEQLTGAPHS